MDRIAQAMKQNEILLADGAWGTNLIAAGLDPKHDMAEGWNLRAPDRIAGLTASFVAAGAKILTTNTFGANHIRLARFGLADQWVAINQAGVQLTRDGASPSSIIAASMGPTGLKHIADNRAAIATAYADQARILDDAGADFLLLETMTSPEEAQLALTSLKAVSALPVICSFAFTREINGNFSTWSGASVASAFQTALEGGAAMVGANCVPADDQLKNLLPIVARHAAGAPLWLKPNAGVPAQPARELTYPHPVCELAIAVEALTAHKVAVIGGCCGTTPAHLRQLAMRFAPGETSPPQS